MGFFPQFCIGPLMGASALIGGGHVNGGVLEAKSLKNNNFGNMLNFYLNKK